MRRIKDCSFKRIGIERKGTGEDWICFIQIYRMATKEPVPCSMSVQQIHANLTYLFGYKTRVSFL